MNISGSSCNRGMRLAHDYIIGRGHVEIPCTMDEWAVWFGHRHSWNNKVGPYVISTICLGLNHNNFGRGAYYGTMIFGTGNNELIRYENWRQARSGHNWIVRDFRKKKRQGRLDGKIYMPWYGDL